MLVQSEMTLLTCLTIGESVTASPRLRSLCQGENKYDKPAILRDSRHDVVEGEGDLMVRIREKIQSLGVAGALVVAGGLAAIVPDALADTEGAVSGAVIDIDNRYEQAEGGPGQDLGANIRKVKNLTEGVVVVTFSTTQDSGSAALLSASNSAEDSTNLTLALRHGHLYWEVRNEPESGKGWLAKADAEDAGPVNDGREHTAVVNVTGENTALYLDGQQVFSTTSASFFDDVDGLDSLRLGANYDSHGKQWGFAGTVSRVQVFDTPVTPSDVAQLSPAPEPILTVADSRAEVPEAVRTAAGKGKITYFYDIDPQTSASAALRRGDTSVQELSVHDDALSLAQGGGRISIPGTWTQSSQTSVAVVVDGDASKVYANGTLIGRKNLPAHSLNTINKVVLEHARLRVFDGALNDAEVKTLSGYSNPGEFALFDSGYEGAASYRIPALLRTRQGTLLATADQRVPNAYDSPNDINLVLRRSTDNGKTWSPLRTLVNLPGSGKQAASVIDSSMVQNEKTGRITLLVDLYPGGVGQPNNHVGTGMNPDGSLALNSAAGITFALKNGAVTDAQGGPTDYAVAEDGTVTLKGERINNVYDPLSHKVPNGLYMQPTAYLVEMHSEDDGVTWSAPRHLNNQVKEDWMKFIGTSPGSAMQIHGGEHDGRLVVPIYYSNVVATVYSSAVVYSDDDGATWQRSTSPNDARVFNGEAINSQTVRQGRASLHESAVVQTGENELTMYMRNSNPGGRIAVARSTDGGATWSAPEFDKNTPDIFSLPAAKNLAGHTNEVLFANASARLPFRGQGVLRYSNDGGRTWKNSRTFQAGRYVYQAMVELPNGNIGLLWEREWQGLYYTEVPRAWLLDYPAQLIK